jgi:hypothetical protein
MVAVAASGPRKTMERDAPLIERRTSPFTMGNDDVGVLVFPKMVVHFVPIATSPYSHERTAMLLAAPLEKLTPVPYQ